MTKFILSFVIGIAAAFTPALVSTVYAADIDKDSACAGANLELGSASCDGDEEEGDLDSLVATIVNVLSVIVGVIAVIMIIVGGFRFVTSGGDSGKVGAAKSAIIYALIGLVIVALAQIIVRFVLAKLS